MAEQDPTSDRKTMDGTSPNGEPVAETGEIVEEAAGNDAEPSESGRDPRLAILAAELESTKSDYLRALAEVENTRRRAARDRADATQYAITKLARDLLSVVDNLQRALGTVDDEAKGREPVLDSLTKGVEMTERELLTVLDRHGVKPIAAAGEIFDPHIHEAMFELPDPSVPSGTIVQVLESGYTLQDRTLRPARVGIAKGGPKPEPAEDAEAEPASHGQPDSTAEYDRQSKRDQPSFGGKVDESL